MPKVEVHVKPHTRREDGKKVRHEVGATFNATDSEVKAFPDRLKVIKERPAPAKAPPKPKEE